MSIALIPLIVMMPREVRGGQERAGQGRAEARAGAETFRFAEFGDVVVCGALESRTGAGVVFHARGDAGTRGHAAPSGTTLGDGVQGRCGNVCRRLVDAPLPPESSSWQRDKTLTHWSAAAHTQSFILQECAMDKMAHKNITMWH